MKIAIFILSIIIGFAVIWMILRRRTVVIPVADAGANEGNASVVEVPATSNPPVYTLGDKVINLSGYGRYLIRGHSLRPEGLDNGTMVYTLPLSANAEDLHLLPGRFIILRYHTERYAAEHPGLPIPANGFKARIVIAVLSTGLKKSEFEQKVAKSIGNQTDSNRIDEVVAHLWDKYERACGYYSEEKHLIMSVTYRNEGTLRDYSFHSPRYISGVVKFKS